MRYPLLGTRGAARDRLSVLGELTRWWDVYPEAEHEGHVQVQSSRLLFLSFVHVSHHEHIFLQSDRKAICSCLIS